MRHPERVEQPLLGEVRGVLARRGADHPVEGLDRGVVVDPHRAGRVLLAQPHGVRAPVRRLEQLAVVALPASTRGRCRWRGGCGRSRPRSPCRATPGCRSTPGPRSRGRRRPRRCRPGCWYRLGDREDLARRPWRSSPASTTRRPPVPRARRGSTSSPPAPPPRRARSRRGRVEAEVGRGSGGQTCSGPARRSPLLRATRDAVVRRAGRRGRPGCTRRAGATRRQKSDRDVALTHVGERSGAVHGLRSRRLGEQVAQRRADLGRGPAAPVSREGPCAQPVSTVIVPPSISITRPVTSPASSEASQATIGELSSGSAIAEVSKAPSVIRVRATGAIALTVTP